MRRLHLSLTVALWLAYPLCVDILVTRGSAALLPWVFAAFVLMSAVIHVWATRRGSPTGRASLSGLSDLHKPIAGVGVALIMFALLLKKAVFVLVWPAAINVALAFVFGKTLRSPTPIVERLANMTLRDLDAPLSAAERRYCRSVTWLWCGFFVCNAAVATGLAIVAPLRWWAVYNGAVAYVLVGLLWGGEYIVRKARFGRFDDRLWDKLLARAMGQAKVP